MILLKVTCFLIYVYFTNAFGLYGLRNVYRTLLSDRNLTTLENEVTERSIEQPINHFDKSDERTWTMRYFESLEFWKEGGPIFLFIGGEGEADPRFLQAGMINDLAQETNGALYMSEHRYYGKSLPFSEINTKNLLYLSSQQALADIATLLKEIKSSSQYNGSKVVVVGGSYPGNLAAWMKLLYSDLVDAAIASSAPVLAKTDFFEYLETVGDDYKQFGSQECYDKIVTKFNRYEELLQTSAGIEQLKTEEGICDDTDMSKPENQELFFSIKVDSYMNNAQYGSPEEIESDCSETLHNSQVYAFKDISLLLELGFWNKRDNCINYSFESMIESMKNSVDLPWAYQTCTEFGYFQTTSSEQQPFTKNIPVELYYNICSGLFGADFNQIRVDNGVKKTNDLYGGLKPNVTQVIFVNGDMDPWHRLGVLKDLSKDAPAKLVHGTSHCRDLLPYASGDPEEMVQTRKYVKEQIEKWISGY